MDPISDPESWIPYSDYVFNNVRRETVRRDQLLQRELPEPPEGWVSGFDYHLGNVHPPTRTMIAAKKRQQPPPAPKPPPPPPPPPKHILQALAEAHAALKRKSPFLSRLEEMEKGDRRELAQGLITAEMKKGREVALSILREGHASRLEAVRDWYLERYLELFDHSAIEDRPDEAPPPAEPV